MNPRSKGVRGELEVAKLLTLWWEPVEPGVEFCRTPGSGGWQGGGNRAVKLRAEFKVSGDIMTNSKTFPFSVEVKREQRWSWEWLEAGRPSAVWDWWRQCQRAAGEAGAVPWLWFRQNRKPWTIMLPFEYVKHFGVAPPVLVWTARQLARVDYGPRLPVVLYADDWLALKAAEVLRRTRELDGAQTLHRVTLRKVVLG